jgi:NAD(P)-dependent dehydrogenase (short-subunit alcohol dehydrogenase family)
LLQDKTVLIFGGTGLIGRSLVAACLEQGATVIAAARKPDPAAFADLPEDWRKRLELRPADVNEPVDVDALFPPPSSATERIDAVVNCAYPRSAGYGAKFEDVKYEDFCDNVTMHLGSAFLVCQMAARYFTATGGGNIVNVSSIYGFMTPRFEIYEGTEMTKEVEYIVAKSAIIHLTRYLAKYLKGRDIRVNCVSPGGVSNGEPNRFVERYDNHCLNKGMLDGADVVGTVLFLLSDHSRYVNGQNIVVDDGFSL